MHDSSNLQITIDLAALHAQNRDFGGYRRCYQKLIGQISGRSQFWIGMMIGYYMEGNYKMCIEAIHSFRGTIDETPRLPLCFSFRWWRKQNVRLCWRWLLPIINRFPGISGIWAYWIWKIGKTIILSYMHGDSNSGVKMLWVFCRS